MGKTQEAHSAAGRFAWAAFAVALTAYPILLSRYIVGNSATFDEGTHLAAGYSYWHCGDYGVNPEHPPLVKLIAAAPLRNWQISELSGPCGTTSRDEMLAAQKLINSPRAVEMLASARTVLVVFPLLLLIVLFFATRAWFGPTAAGWAMLLTIFDPNLTAHSVLVTTDLPLTAATVLALFCAWRFSQRPSPARVLWLGLSIGLALAIKHSGVLVPVIVLLACVTFALGAREGRGRLLLRLAGGWAIACALAIVLLWGVYRFRFDALAGAPLDVAAFVRQNNMAQTFTGKAAQFFAGYRLLPEAWIYGLIYALHNTSHTTYLFGRELVQSPWYYFPVVLSIKTPVTVGLLCIAGLAMPGLWKRRIRQSIFLGMPMLVFLTSAILSGIGLGLRHILPLYPSLIIFAAGAAGYLCERFRWGVGACAVLLIFSAASYARSFPNEIAYANEAWGGPHHLRFYLSDSNLDWSQTLYQVKDWVMQHNAQPCWIAWFGMQKPASLGIPCELLAGPSYLESADATLAPPIPDHFGGTVLISSGLLDYDLYPYRWFRTRHPDDVIGECVLVFRGQFDRPEVAAERRMSRGWWMLRRHQPAAAAADLQAAAPYANERPILNWLIGWAAADQRKESH